MLTNLVMNRLFSFEIISEYGVDDGKGSQMIWNRVPEERV